MIETTLNVLVSRLNSNHQQFMYIHLPTVYHITSVKSSLIGQSVCHNVSNTSTLW